MDAWAAERAELAGPDGGFNMGWAAADRHVANGDGARPALRWLARDGTAATLTYGELAERSSRFADVLRRHGVGRGDAVFTLLPRRPELAVATLGILKAGGLVAPLFAAFGPEPLRLRLERGRARAVVTTEALWRRKGLAAPCPLLTVESLPDRLAAADPAAAVAPTGPDDLALLHYTSGTTGAPKGALHAHGALVVQVATARRVLGLRAGDVCWCTADPGWVTGTVYGLLAPLACGATVVLDEGDFDPARWYGVIARERVAVWYSTPTAVRLLMRAGPDLPRRFDLTSLRHLASVGEPLNPEAVRWSAAVLGHPFHDTWWQTETGAIMVATAADADPEPGVLGTAVPGITAAVVRRAGGGVTVLEAADAEGELALRAPWPSLFRGFLGEEERTRACFADGWYLSGDLVRRAAGGRLRFVGRADDLISSSGHRIGPFEVESVLLEHPAVAEAAVIGLPDPVCGEAVNAVVALKPGAVPGDALALDLIAHARRRLGPALAPRAVSFAPSLPHTRSGKIMRRLLRARAMGLPEGDLSTLEPEA